MNSSILFGEFPLDHLDAAAAALSEIYRIPNVDARTRIRKGWGFLEREVPEESAAQIVAALAERGVSALVVANDKLRFPGDPQVMTGFQIDRERILLQLQSTEQAPLAVPWSSILVLAACGISEEVIRRESGGDEPQTGKLLMSLGVFMVTGLPLGVFGGGKKQTVKEIKSSRLITFGRIVTAEGAQFAFSPDHFDFSGLGPLKQLNASLNYRSLLERVSGLCPARLNLGARLVLDNRSLLLANYQSLHDFETELLWLMNAPAAPQAPT